MWFCAVSAMCSRRYEDAVGNIHNAQHFLFFQAEDGIRDHCVTGVQTCALPIWVIRVETDRKRAELRFEGFEHRIGGRFDSLGDHEIGRASCRERV